MRVLFIQQGLGYGGASQSLIQMQKCLKDDVEMYTILKRNRRLNKQLKHLLQYSKLVVEMDIPGIYSYSEGISTQEDLDLALSYDTKELIAFIIENKIDIVHVNASVFGNLYAMIKSKTSAKIVTHIREVIPKSEDAITRFIVHEIKKFSDWIIPIAHEEMKHFSGMVNCTMAINPVDTAVFQPRVDRPNTEVISIGMMANFNPLKGHLLFLEVVQALQLKNSGKHKVQFQLLGMPSPGFMNVKQWFPMKRFAYYQEVIHKIRKLKNVHLVCIPFQENVQSVIQQWDIGLRLEKSMMPWGRDIIEIMAVGVPMVALGSSEVIIQNGKTGILVNSREVDPIVEAIQVLIDDQQQRESMGVNARQWVIQNAAVDTYRDTIYPFTKKCWPHEYTFF
jgi:glycosyltransferase involved in cell wall biosynthesis